jgi:hypothetical protein
MYVSSLCRPYCAAQILVGLQARDPAEFENFNEHIFASAIFKLIP